MGAFGSVGSALIEGHYFFGKAKVNSVKRTIVYPVVSSRGKLLQQKWQKEFFFVTLYWIRRQYHQSMPEKVIIYTKDYCPYCNRAKEYFSTRGIAFEEIDITRDPQLYADLKQRTGHMTVPQIFIDGQFVGGYSDLIDKVRRGELLVAEPRDSYKR
jgi:GrxC family glutaredoxin